MGPVLSLANTSLDLGLAIQRLDYLNALTEDDVHSQNLV